MKKLLYVCKYSLVHNISLTNKYDGQIKGFKCLGLDVYYMAFDDQNYYLMHNGNKDILKRISNGKSSRYLHLAAFIDMYRCALIAMKNLNFDYLYVRNDPIDINGIAMYRLAKNQGIKVITEVPSYPVYRDNVKNPIRKIMLGISDMMLRYISKYVDIYTVIGNSCTVYNNKPAINIYNGVDIELFALKKPMADDSINIIGVASMSKWQGYDRAIKGLAQYKGNKNIHLRLVGNDGDGSLAEWKELATRLNVSNKVEFIPALYGDDLNELINKSDVGLATLALFRSGLKEASPLKAREYMSRGLPIVCSSNDSTLLNAQQYLCIVPEDDSPLDMNKIVDFAHSVKNNMSISEAMRSFALENMTWESTLKNVFARLEEICKN